MAKKNIIDPNAAVPAWSLSPSRMKSEVLAKNDPTGMRQAALNLNKAYTNATLGSLDQYSNEDALQEARNNLLAQGIGLGMLDPYSGGNQSRLLGKTAPAPGQLEAYIQKTAPGALDEYQNYMNKFGQWKDQYTSPELDAQIRTFEKGLPDLQFLGGQDSVANRINSNLMAYGISNLNQVGARPAADGTTEFFNKANGQTLPDQLMHFKSNHQGTLRVGLGRDQNGNVVLRNDFEGPKAQFGDYAGQAILAALGGMAGGAMAPALSGAIGGATGMGSTAAGIAGQAAAQGLVGGALAGAQGGDIGKGALLGAISGGVGAGVNAINPAQYVGVTNPILSSVINKGLSGGLTGGLGSVMNGGNFGEGALKGGISGAMSGLVSGSLGELGMNNQLAGTLGGLAGTFAGSQFGKSSNGNSQSAPNPLVPQMPTQTVSPLGRTFDISGFTQPQQQNIQTGFGRLQQYGVPGLNDIRWIT